MLLVIVGAIAIATIGYVLYNKYIVEEKESKTKITNQNHKPMNYILKGLDKYGVTKYQSRVFGRIEKLKELRTMNKVTFPFLTFIIYDQNGKTYL